jgi:hypothetical protein
MLSESKFLEIYQRQQESALSVKDFCSNEGIKESTFYYWRKKLAEQGRIKGFIPLVIKTPRPALNPDYHKQSSHSCNLVEMSDNFLFELVYTNGTKLRIQSDIDISQLRTLISLND